MATVDWRREGNFLLLRAPYNEDFLADLKSCIPSRYRSWVPRPAQCWRIHKMYREDVHRLVLGYFSVDLPEPQPSKAERDGRTGTEDAFTAPGAERMRTADGIEALRASLQAAQARNAQLDLQNRLLLQAKSALESQLAMERAGRGSGPSGTASDPFSVRGFLRLFGARGFKSLVRVAHPDVNADRAEDAHRFTQELTKLAAEMGIS
jgi:hypothetical protein